MNTIKTDKWIELKCVIDNLLYQAVDMYFEIEDKNLPFTDKSRPQLENEIEKLYELINRWEVELSENFINCEKSKWVSYCYIVHEKLQKWNLEYIGIQKDMILYPDNSNLIFKTEIIEGLHLYLQTITSTYSNYYQKSKDTENWKSISEYNSIDQKTEDNILQKIKWQGTPGQFAFVIDLLINKGYIEKPTQFGERSAQFLLQHFEIKNHKPSKQSLGRMLHKEYDPIVNPEHKSRFYKIPSRNDLDK